MHLCVRSRCLVCGKAYRRYFICLQGISVRNEDPVVSNCMIAISKGNNVELNLSSFFLLNRENRMYYDAALMDLLKDLVRLCLEYLKVFDI